MSAYLQAQISALLDPATRKLVGFRGDNGVEYLMGSIAGGLPNPTVTRASARTTPHHGAPDLGRNQRARCTH